MKYLREHNKKLINMKRNPLGEKFRNHEIQISPKS